MLLFLRLLPEVSTWEEISLSMQNQFSLCTDMMHYFRDVHNTIFLSFDVEGSEKAWKSGEEIESFDGAEFAFLKISQIGMGEGNGLLVLNWYS